MQICRISRKIKRIHLTAGADAGRTFLKVCDQRPRHHRGGRAAAVPPVLEVGRRRRRQRPRAWGWAWRSAGASAREMGGDLVYESHPAAGACFVLELKAGRVAAFFISAPRRGDCSVAQGASLGRQRPLRPLLFCCSSEPRQGRQKLSRPCRGSGREEKRHVRICTVVPGLEPLGYRTVVPPARKDRRETAVRTCSFAVHFEP